MIILFVKLTQKKYMYVVPDFVNMWFIMAVEMLNTLQRFGRRNIHLNRNTYLLQ